jgi:hypothetical protein
MKKHIAYVVSETVGHLWAEMNRAGFQTRLVGGAVRDLVMGHEPKDYDFCTTATPEQMIAFAEQYDYRIEPTGLQHGTVSFIVDGVAYEFTTLRIDTDCDGRHASVQFTTDFEADAARRDFTFNAMSCDINGKVYDYFGGWEDAKTKTVRFVGNAADRIAEDYLRVLRFFRFAARYGANMDIAALDIMCFPEVHGGLKHVSRERIWAEVSKMVTYQDRNNALGSMFMTGVARAIGMVSNQFSVACLHNAKTAPAFMAGFCGQDPIAFGREWKMSVAEIQEMEFVFRNSDMTVRNILRMRLNGVPENLVVSACQVHTPSSMVFATGEFPKFPVTGSDLMQEGFKPGPAMGQELAKRKAAWVESQVAKMFG